jgi:hypothetical protein
MTKINPSESNLINFKTPKSLQTIEGLRDFLNTLPSTHPTLLKKVDNHALESALESVQKILLTQLIALSVGYQKPDIVERAQGAYLSQISHHCKQSNTTLAKMKNPKEIAIITKQFNNAEEWVTIKDDGTETRAVKPAVANTKEMQKWQEELDMLIAMALGSGLAARTAPIFTKNTPSIRKTYQVGQPLFSRALKRPKEAPDLQVLSSSSGYTKKELKMMSTAFRNNEKKLDEESYESKIDAARRKQKRNEAQDRKKIEK